MSKQYRLPLANSEEIVFKCFSAEDADRYYQALLNSESNSELEEYLFNLLTEDKYLSKINTFDAGIILTVIYASFSLSNVLSDIASFPEMIEKARAKSDTLYKVLYTKICKAMPYKLDELKSKSLNELLELFTLAEDITESPINIEKLKEAVNLASPRARKDNKAPHEILGEDKLNALKEHLDFLQGADLDDDGRFIGDMSMIE